MKRILPCASSLLILIALVAAPGSAEAVSQCGPLNDNSCACGTNNPYPCCSNGGNCTWYAWYAACCNWGKSLPGWGNANTWSSYASAHPDYQVTGTPTPNCIANRVTPQYPGDQWGHVAWVESVGSKVKVRHMGCWSFYGVKTGWYDLNFFDGFICMKGQAGPIGPSCGDGSCNGGETCKSCDEDCGACCGNGACDYGETCKTCDQDCGACCGNGACDYDETCKTCEGDCGPCCGNGACDYDETCQTCEKDCGPCCGNGTCDGFIPEHCFNCPEDCNKCCGNGSCDWGENCDSCPNDCGECVYLPQGYVESANCLFVEGWSDDPDVDAAVTLELLVDGEVVEELVAELPTEEHGDTGFKAQWPEAFKDGEAHVVEIRAYDESGTGGLIPGSGRWVLCGSGQEVRGIWTITRYDVGGMDMDLEPTFKAGSALRLVHPGDLQWPIAGEVIARTRLGLDPLDEVRFHADGGFDQAFYEIELLSGEAAEPFGDTGDRQWTPGGQPGDIGLRLGVLENAVDPSHRVLEISGLEARTGPWWNHYSWDAAGFTWAHEALDRVAFELRAGGIPTRGFASTWHRFDEPFDGLSLDVDQDLVAGLAAQVLVDGELIVQLGPSFLQTGLDLELEGEEIRFRFVSEPDVAATEGSGIRLENIRVFRNRSDAVYPWMIVQDRAWGLAGELPPAPELPGLSVRLIGAPAADWFASGSIEARTQIAEEACQGCAAFPEDPEEPEHDVPAFDRVRGVAAWDAGPNYSGQLRVNGEVILDLEGGTSGGKNFDVEEEGWFFSARILTDPEDPPTTDASLEVTGLSFHRGGWWSTADNETVGIVDGRLEDCGVLLKAQPGWADAGLAAAGSLMVHRDFASPITGVRFHRDGGAAGIALSLVVDGQDAKVWTDPAGASDEVWTGVAGGIGFRLTVPEAKVFDSVWEMAITDIEVKVGGTWRAACDQPEAQVWTVPCTGDACDEPDQPAPGTVEGSKGGSCDVGLVPVSGWGLMLLLLLAVVVRRRA